MSDPLAGTHATILGLAREGTALARYLVSVGARVTISDSRQPADLRPALKQIANLPVRLVLDCNRPEDAATADTLYLSPGVPLTLPAVLAARAAGVPLSSEPLLFLARCKAPVIGITGSSGKTTTTSLIGAMLQADGRRVYVGGNIGRPLIGNLNEIHPTDSVVMELSSFQLALFDRGPAIGVVTTLSPDHLDRHASLEEYYEAKRNLVRFQRSSDIAILNAGQPEVRAFASGLKSEVRWFSMQGPVERGAFVRDGLVWLAGDETRPIMPVRDIRLRGEHNVANVLAAAAAASAAGASDAAIAEAASQFAGVAHRLEYVGTSNGAAFFNDSIATSPERAMAALRSFSEPIIWLAGGRSKLLPVDDLAHEAVARVKTSIIYGESAPELLAALDAAGATNVLRAATMEDAVALARKIADPGDVVLLSPACTSFDQFRDYEARGQAFRHLVRTLEGDVA